MAIKDFPGDMSSAIIDANNDLLLFADASDSNNAKKTTASSMLWQCNTSMLPATTDNNYLTDAEQTKLWHITVTQAVDLDTMESDIAGKEPTISAGTTSQYRRGDKSWQTLDKTAVGLGNVDNTSDSTKNSAVVTLTNKTIDLTSNTLTGTKAQFDTAVTDGNFLYVGDVTSNATHTGDVTGDTALTIDKTAITGKTAVTAVGTDYVLISDTSDSGNLKKALVSDFGWGWSVWPGTINEIAYFDTTTSIASLPVATYPSLTELTYVKGVTSAIQTQLSAKVTWPASATDNAIARFDSTTGKLIQDSWATLGDDASISGGNFYLTALANWVSIEGSAAAGGRADIYATGADTNIDLYIDAQGTGRINMGKDVVVPDEAYWAGWNGSLEVPTKNAVYDKIETLQPLDTQLTSLAGLSYTGNALKVIRVNAGETDFELATAGAGDVVKVGTPVNNQLWVWTGDGTIEWDASLTFDTTVDKLTVAGSIDINDWASNSSLNSQGTLDAYRDSGNSYSLNTNTAGSAPYLEMYGADTNIGFELTTKGTGRFTVNSVNVPTISSTDTLSNKTLTAPKFADLWFIADANGNELIIFDTVASAVNEITLANSATGWNPILSATGGDANVGFNFQAKGTGTYNFLGTASQQAEIRLSEDTDNGAHYVAIKWPASLAASYTLELPADDGSASQVLTTNGSWVLTWTTPSWGTFIGVRCKLSGAQSITGTGLSVVNFDAETYDTDTMHDTGSNTSRITFNTAGYYTVTAILNSDVNAIIYGGIRLNGSTYIGKCGVGNSGANTANGMNLTINYYFSATDYVELLGSFGTAGATACKVWEDGTLFMAAKIG